VATSQFTVKICIETDIDSGHYYTKKLNPCENY